MSVRPFRAVVWYIGIRCFRRRCSERPGESQASLLGELLGATAGADCRSELAATASLLGLTEASAHVSTSQVVVVDVHRGSFDVVVEEVLVGVVRDAAGGAGRT